MKPKYRFVGRVGQTYIWQGPRVPGDSRSEEVRVYAGWFWNRSRRRLGLPPIELQP